MRVIFIGDPNELEGMAHGHGLSRTSTTIYGVTFPMSAEVDVSHLPLKLQQKLLNNPHFRAAGVDAEPVRSLVLPAGVESAAAVDADDEAAEAADVAALAARLATKPKKKKAAA